MSEEIKNEVVEEEVTTPKRGKKPTEKTYSEEQTV